MTRLTPDIVYAAVDAVRNGRIFGADEDPEDALRSVVLVLRVQDVLAGGSFVRDETVQLELGPVSSDVDVSAYFTDMVGDSGLFFLHRKGTAQSEFGVTADSAERALDLYRPVTSQGAFLNDRGRVALPFWMDATHFPAELRGTSFEELLERVRSLTS